MAKDKFKQMQQGGGVGSFQETLVQAATTVAAIERQQENAQPVVVSPAGTGSPSNSSSAEALAINPQQPLRFMRLPNPQIPLQEYNLVSRYCEQFANMTRQDFVELAIIEKLHNDGGMSQDDFNRRYEEIRNRPPRGQRKGMKSGSSSSSSSE
jgi:hypothetical protein